MLVKVNQNELYNIVESLVNKIDLINESDNVNLDSIKEDLEIIYESFLEYKKSNMLINNDDLIIIEELESMFSQYDYL